MLNFGGMGFFFLDIIIYSMIVFFGILFLIFWVKCFFFFIIFGMLLKINFIEVNKFLLVILLDDNDGNWLINKFVYVI